jgi:hypothetical protein
MTEDTNPVVQDDEMTTLKKNADLMGITYHPSIGIEKLRTKINEVLNAKEPADSVEPNSVNPDEDNKQPDPDADETGPEPGEVAPVKETEAQWKHRMKKEASALIRIRITCMNPAKREWEGEIFTVGNSVVPTQKKFVPYDTEYHVPQIMYDMIKDRRCQIFVTAKDGRGNKTRQGKIIKEFGIELLDPLTEQELKDLAQRQAMANGTSD